MRTVLVLASLVGVSLVARADTPGTAPKPKPGDPPSPGAGQTSTSARTRMLSPIQIDSLTLTPIVAVDVAKDGVNLIVLDEAMASKTVRIHEVDDGDVNNLTLDNKNTQPLFLLAGEVILGGKQDRIIGRNTIIPPRTTQTVPVFCVEHGRWDDTQKKIEFKSAKALAHGRLRGRASFDSQQDVWNEVSAKNAARKTDNSTDTYRTVAKQQSDGSMAKLGTRVDAELAKLKPDDRAKLVGFAVALNGKVATVDVFGSPQLFAKLRAKLVQSYVTDAVDIVAKPSKAPTEADVKMFMADAEQAAAKESFDTAVSATTVNAGARAAKSKVEYKPAKSPDRASPAPAAVYETYQAR